VRRPEPLSFVAGERRAKQRSPAGVRPVSHVCEEITVSTPTDSRPELVTVIAHMRAKPGKEQDLLDALEALIEPTSQEEGYVNYDLHQGIEDSSLFYLYENWESVDTHETHMHTPHLEDFGGRLDDLLDGNLTVVRVRRIA
jgi:quinol monooxygenase YgiN